MPNEIEVLRLGDVDDGELAQLLNRYRLKLRRHPDHQPIPGSYWGDAEAGLSDASLYARSDTPLHSILHETCHYVCMDADRRRQLQGSAGGDDAEESAVCYLQVLLSDQLQCLGRKRMFIDMDAWGYSFRLGSSQVWFESDADEARNWLEKHRLIDANQKPRYRLR